MQRDFFPDKYRVPISRDDWVAPEETLLDAASEHADVAAPISGATFPVLLIGTAVLCAAILGFVAQFSLFQHASYALRAFQNRTDIVFLPPPRGMIFDRNGRPLVENVPRFDLVAVSSELPRDEDVLRSEAASVGDILGVSANELYDELSDGRSGSAMFFLRTGISQEKLADIKNQKPPGIFPLITTERNYIDGGQFAHIIGYTGSVGEADLSADSYYTSNDTVGRAGIEAQYESVLRGEHGQISFTKTGDGVVVNEVQPRGGSSVVLNIDRDLQKALYTMVFRALHDSGLSRAAAVVQDPRTGAVLAMVSFPTFDNNVFSGTVSETEFQNIVEGPGAPLFNRVISGRYNPGSTIKPFIALAALQEKVVRPEDTIQDCISLTVPNENDPEAAPYVFRNWRPDTGPFNVTRAIADSCNVYFYTVGGGFGGRVGLGIERIVQYLHGAVADVALGIDLPGETGGFVPTPDSKRKTTGEEWYLGDTYNVSIGQGDLLVTPLWLNSYISAVANGGILYRPRVAERVVDARQKTIETVDSSALTAFPFGSDTIAVVQSAMRETVLSGTGKLLQDIPVPVAAKSGTAEVKQGLNALFTAYAPYGNPEVAVTVLIEDSPHTQGNAIHAVHDFLQYYFGQFQRSSP